MDFSQFKTRQEAVEWCKKEKGMTGTEANAWLAKKVPLEKYYQGKIIEWIKKNAPQAFVWKATQGAYSRKGIPDVCVVIGGRFYGFEIKRPFFGVISQMQTLTIKQIEKAGGKAYIVTYAKEVADILQKELER